MMAPLPTPSHADDQPELPRVRLEVRAQSGRPVTYEVGADDFLIGGSAGCDLRLPTANLPPVICQISRKSDGVRVRRLTPVLPVLLNGAALPANATTPVAAGDVLALADIEITFAIPSAPSLVVPRFVPLEVEASAHSSTDEQRNLDERRRQLDDEEAIRREEWTRRDAELIRRARDLDRQTEELESDRVLWYRRRQEIEQELERHHAATGLAGARKADQDGKERELVRLRDDLSALRERLLTEYQERRDELSGQQEKINLQHRKLEAEAAAQRELVEEELRQRRAAVEAELAARAARTESEALGRFRGQFEELERLRAAAREAIAQARAEAEQIRGHAQSEDARRRMEVATELGDYEPRMRELT